MREALSGLLAPPAPPGICQAVRYSDALVYILALVIAGAAFDVITGFTRCDDDGVNFRKNGQGHPAHLS